MLQYIIELDEQLLLLCNGVHTPWLDNFFWIVTSRSLNIFVALPLLLILGGYIHNNPHKKKALFDAMLVVVALAVAVLIADQVASSVFKPLFQRLRPSRDPDFKQFESIEWGYRAIFVTLNTYRRKYGLRTIREMISRWAPPVENHTEAYIRAVTARTGFSADAVLDTRSRQQMIQLIAAMSEVENGVKADFRAVERGWELYVNAT